MSTRTRARVDPLVVVASAGLPTAAEPPTDPLGLSEWRALLRTVRAQRMSGLLSAALASGFPATPEQVAEAGHLHAGQCAWVLKLERRLLALSAQLRSTGIDHRVLKGSALAHLDYDDPADRCFVDVDLVVPARSFPAVCARLTQAGGERRYAEPRPGFDVRFSKGASFLLPDGVDIDLHRTLVLGYFGLRLDPEALFADAEWFSVGTQRLPALAHPERLVHACIHASLGTSDPRWMPVRDVAQLTVRADDTAAVLDRARQWRCEAVVADAVNHAWARLQLTVDHDLVRWAREYPITNRDQSHLAAYRGTGRSHARMALDGLSAVGGWTDRARYLHALLFPQRAPQRLPTRTRLRHGMEALRTWWLR